MTIIIGLTLLVIASGILVTRTNSEPVELVCLCVCLLSTAFLATALISLPVERMTTRAGIEQFEETRRTVERGRAAGRNIETAAIQVDIAQANRWLARKQYYNRTVFSLWIPNEVDELRPIE